MRARTLLPIMALLTALPANAATYVSLSRFSIEPVLPASTATKVVTDLGRTVGSSGYGDWTATEESPLVMVATLTANVTNADRIDVASARMHVDGSFGLQNLSANQQYCWLIFFTEPVLISSMHTPGPATEHASYGVDYFGSSVLFSVDYADAGTPDYTAGMGGSAGQTGRYPLRTLVLLPALSSATVD